MTALALVLGLGLLCQADSARLGLADLPEYRKALESKANTPGRRVGFRDLWDRPAEFHGQRVSVEGKLARRFHQPATGTFPPLAEAWLQTQAGDLFCVAYPDSESDPRIPLGKAVTFTGTFLRLVEYEGRDTHRLAPLVVGSAPPTAGLAPQPSSPSLPTRSLAEWAVGLILAVVVVWVLLFQHLRRPVHRPLEIGPAPKFETNPDENPLERID